MGRFNPKDYQTVDDRIHEFYSKNPNGGIDTELVSNPEKLPEYAAFRATVLIDGIALASGYAMDIKGQGGMANKDAWVENAETSAIGRALANAGYSPKGKRPSREEMTKASGAGNTNNSLGRGKPASDTTSDGEASPPQSSGSQGTLPPAAPPSDPFAGLAVSKDDLTAIRDKHALDGEQQKQIWAAAQSGADRPAIDALAASLVNGAEAIKEAFDGNYVSGDQIQFPDSPKPASESVVF